MYLTLDFARGIAALGVFLFHIHGMFITPAPFFAQIVRIGSLGVPLFFVISGYVITASAERTIKRGTSANGFLKRRFLRIFPPFWASIVVVVLTPYVIEALSSIKTGEYVSPSPPFAGLSWVEWLEVVTLVKGFEAVDGDLQRGFAPVNAVYWSLAIEFQFYLIMYFALVFRRYFWPILSAVTAVSIWIALWQPPVLPGLFIGFWPTFALGIGLYLALSRGISLSRLAKGYSPVLSASILPLVVATLIVLASKNTIREILQTGFASVSLGFGAIAAFAIWIAAPLEPSLIKLKDAGGPVSRWLVKLGAFLGVISYSTYLLHGKLYQIPWMFVRHVLPPESMLTPFFVVMGTLMLCAVFYRFVEKPFLSGEHKTINAEVLVRHPQTSHTGNNL